MTIISHSNGLRICRQFFIKHTLESRKNGSASMVSGSDQYNVVSAWRMSKHVLASITRDCSVDGMVQQAPADRKLKYFLHRHLGSALSGPAQCCPPAGSPHLGWTRVLARCSRTARSAPEHGAARARTRLAPQDGGREEPPGMEQVERPGKGVWKKLGDWISRQSGRTREALLVPPSTTSLDPPGTELGALVGRDAPPHNVLEEPHEHLAVDRRQRRPLPSGGKSPPGRRASSAGAPESSTRACPARDVEAGHPSAGPGHGPGPTRPGHPRSMAQAASGDAPARPVVAAACPPGGSCPPPAPRRVRPAPDVRRAASPPAQDRHEAGWESTARHPWPRVPARRRTVCAGPRRHARAR